MFTHRWNRVAGTALLILAAALQNGCRGPRPPLVHETLPEGVPGVQQLLADLAANDARIESFREKLALLTLKSPKLKATQVLSADVAFERPDRLYIVGRQRVLLRSVIFRLRSVGDEYMVQVPSEGSVFASRGGEQFEGVPFSVSPSDLVRELFVPVDWASLDPAQVRLAEYDPASQRAVLVIGPRRHPDRRVVVEGPPWRLVESERLGDDGQVYARTTRSDYREWEGGIRFPTAIVASFPLQQTELRLEKIDNPKFNIALEESLFDIDWNEYSRSRQ